MILLVDDNPAVARAMEIAFRLAGHHLDVASGPEEALSRLAASRYDAILLDMNFSAGQSSGEEGLALLKRILGEDPSTCVVVLTAHSGIRIAVSAMQAGARDFVMKPWRNAELIAKVEAAIKRVALPAPVISQRDAEAAPARMIGESLAMQHLRELVRRVGPTSAGVTITGPAGSGRSLTALAIHAISFDAGTPPVRIDLRDESAWSRLDEGWGTVILRHPDKLSPLTQARLLERLWRDRRYIAIADEIGNLIPALRWKIATMELAVPPLDQRERDPVLLARHFARLAAIRFGRSEVNFTQAAEAAILNGSWPDEVRGLALAIERAVLLTDGDTIDAAALVFPVSTPSFAGVGNGFDLTHAERAMVEAALREHRHNVSQAAAALGLSRGALYRRMARYGL